jgi:hypothetical protein
MRIGILPHPEQNRAHEVKDIRVTNAVRLLASLLAFITEPEKPGVLLVALPRI